MKTATHLLRIQKSISPIDVCQTILICFLHSWKLILIYKENVRGALYVSAELVSEVVVVRHI